MYAHDIRQYLVCQNLFSQISTLNTYFITTLQLDTETLAICMYGTQQFKATFKMSKNTHFTSSWLCWLLSVVCSRWLHHELMAAVNPTYK